MANPQQTNAVHNLVDPAKDATASIEGKCEGYEKQLQQEFGNDHGALLYKLWLVMHVLGHELVNIFGFQNAENMSIHLEPRQKEARMDSMARVRAPGEIDESAGQPQDELSSVENQIEHVHDLFCNAFVRASALPSNRRRSSQAIFPDSDLPSEAARTVATLYRHQFEGYRDWCASQDIACTFSNEFCASISASKTGGFNASFYIALHHLLLYYFLWGEGANVRHMPE